MSRPRWSFEKFPSHRLSAGVFLAANNESDSFVLKFDDNSMRKENKKFHRNRINMSKFLISFLLAGLLTFTVCLAGKRNKINDLANEIDQESETSLDGGLIDVDNFGANDVIQNGIPKLIDEKENNCIYSRHERKCKVCCAVQGDSHSWTLKPNAKRLRIFQCACHKRTYVSIDQPE